MSNEKTLTSELSYDPYAVWVASLENGKIIKTAETLLCFDGKNHELAIVTSGPRFSKFKQTVNREQLSQRYPKTVLEI